jgi:NAD(P)-dependent dehydrogenase (short-subunit alcohol dehydrogenase family)
MGDRLRDKVALVTGGARGIGQGIAQRFATEGAKVGLLDVSEAGVNETVEMIRVQGHQVRGVVCDVSDAGQVERAVSDITGALGFVDVLVNNAAVLPSGTLHKTSLEDWDAVFAVNVRGVFLVSRAIIPTMLNRGGGSIINMASATGTRGLPGIAAYSATKGALISLTRAMSTDYAPHGIRVNSVSPGTIDSPMLQDFLARQRNPGELRKEFDAMHPIGRVGTIDEVASVCVFLASDEASFVTGSNYEVDGGLVSKGEQPQD